jgi:isocitrate/isopropylmalate dehydrogenase
VTLVVLPGDGVGPTVVEQALRALDATGWSQARVSLPFGVQAFERTGDTLPPATERALREADVALLGAGGTAHGAAQPSSILRLRRSLDLELLVRPVWIEGQRVTLVGHAWDGLYGQVDRADGEDVVRHERVVTGAGTRALLAHAASLATRRVTFVDKPSVFHHTRRLIEREAAAVTWGEASFEVVNADAFVARFLRAPRDFDVLVAYSFVGDVVSDLLAAVAGGVGVAPSISLGDELAVFEPVHGTAPRHVGEAPARVSPVGAIRAAALLLEHVGEAERAARVHAALDDHRLPRTPDQGGDATTADVGDHVVRLVGGG